MYYSILLALSIVFIYLSSKNNLFFKIPIYISYVYSIIFFNVIGSYYVFYPEKSLVLVRKIFLTNSDHETTFFFILLIQLLSFFLFLPIHLNNTCMIKDKFFLSDKIFYRYIYSLSAISLIIILSFFYQSGIPPFFKSGFGEVSNNLIMADRADFFQNINNFWVYSAGFYMIPTSLSILLFINYKIKKSNFDKIIFFVYFFIAAILSLSFLHKYPLIYLITQLFFASIIFDQKINLYRVLYFGISCVTLIFLSYLLVLSADYYAYDSGFILTRIFQTIFQRVVVIYSLSLSVVPEIVHYNGFFQGSVGMINPLGLLDIEQFNLQKELHLLMYGIPGNNPAPAIGYAYANFGYTGILSFVFLINILIYIYQSFCNRINNQHISIFVTIFFMMKAINLSMTTVWDNLLNPQELVTLTICLTIYFLILKVSRAQA